MHRSLISVLFSISLVATQHLVSITLLNSKYIQGEMNVTHAMKAATQWRTQDFAEVVKLFSGNFDERGKLSSANKVSLKRPGSRSCLRAL